LQSRIGPKAPGVFPDPGRSKASKPQIPLYLLFMVLPRLFWFEIYVFRLLALHGSSGSSHVDQQGRRRCRRRRYVVFRLLLTLLAVLDLSFDLRPLRSLSWFLVAWVAGKKKKEVKKETKLGMAYKKDDNFGEWYSEVRFGASLICIAVFVRFTSDSARGPREIMSGGIPCLNLAEFNFFFCLKY
jgi:hypothetical protein